MFGEDDLLPISGLQHWAFCPRQCGLIHLDRLWAENRLTAQGRTLHQRAHDGPDESRGDVRIVRHMPLRCLSLGLFGVADIVEFHAALRNSDTACVIAGWDGHWLPRPVEYKRGRPKAHDADLVQLCAQAICLEEMLAVQILSADLYYGLPRRRTEVSLCKALRTRTATVAEEFRRMMADGKVPPPQAGRRCRACSLRAMCMPDAVGASRVRRYMTRMRWQAQNALQNEERNEDAR